MAGKREFVKVTRTAKVMVALCTRRTECIGVFGEACPLLRIPLLGILGRETVPNTRVDLTHLLLFNDLDRAEEAL